MSEYIQEEKKMAQYICFEKTKFFIYSSIRIQTYSNIQIFATHCSAKSNKTKITTIKTTKTTKTRNLSKENHIIINCEDKFIFCLFYMPTLRAVQCIKKGGDFSLSKNKYIFIKNSHLCFFSV